MRPQSYLIATSSGESPVSSHFLALGLELQRRGHRVAVLTGTPESEVQTPGKGLRIYRWPQPRPVTFRDTRFLMSLVSRHKPDCAIANFGAVNLFAFAHWLRRVPVRIVWYHTLSAQIDLDSSTPGWRLRLLRLRKSLVYSLASHIFANSQVALADVQRTFHVPRSKCFVQTLSLNDPLAGQKRHAPGNGSIKILCVGRCSPSKGQDTLIQALAKLEKNLAWQAVFIGDGPTRPSLERLAVELGVANRCVFAGARSHEHVLGEMTTAAVSVIPSRAEAFGFVGLESMAVGLPILASNTGGLAEVIRDEVDGFLVPPGDRVAFANRLERLLNDAKLRQRLGENGRERFLRNFERSRVIPEQADWMENVVRLDS